MKRNTIRSFGLPVALSLVIFGAGCATSGEVDEASRLAQEAKTSADQASRTAADAAASAQEAKAAAAAAQRAAEEARAAAQQINEKLDRAFKKAVEK